jgi:hypothetical protein
MDCCLEDLSPEMVAAIPSRTCKQRTVADALHDHAWPTDISRGLLLVGLFEYFNYGIYSTRQSSLRTTMSMF